VTQLELHQLRKTFGRVVAVDSLDLDIDRGELVSLVGPSGCGKTTTLRMVAGLQQADRGRILLEGRDVTHDPANRRGMGVVFQSYALFPNMTGAENIAYGLAVRKRSSAEVKRKVTELVELIQIGDAASRYPHQLSGGQQQRVALARAVVFEPRLLLMDEPLGALDRKLREALQLEILHVSRELGATVLYVTHDQEEALVMSDRVAIFSAGRIEQLGTGEDLYDRPASLFVADFIGESNILRGRYERDATGGWLVRETRRWRVGEPAAERAALENGSPAALIVRPERMRMATPTDAPPSNANVVDATVDVVLYLGSDRKYELALPDGLRAAVRRQRDGADREWQRGDQVALEWAIDDGVLVADPTD